MIIRIVGSERDLLRPNQSEASEPPHLLEVNSQGLIINRRHQASRVRCIDKGWVRRLDCHCARYHNAPGLVLVTHDRERGQVAEVELEQAANWLAQAARTVEIEVKRRMDR